MIELIGNAYLYVIGLIDKMLSIIFTGTEYILSIVIACIILKVLYASIKDRMSDHEKN